MSSSPQTTAAAPGSGAGGARLRRGGPGSGRGFRRRTAIAAATAVYLAFIGWVTLGPQPYDPTAAGLLDRVLAILQGTPVTAWMTFGVVEFTANVALFLPLGALLALLLGTRRWWIVLALAVTLTCAIELAQGAWLPTRVSDPRDVLANSTGGALGIAFVVGLLPRHRDPAQF